MAEELTLICDQCGTAEETPAYGWVALRKARKSEINSTPPARGDFCGVDCLTAYVARMSIQASLDGAISDAIDHLDLPAEPGESENA